jgi:SAM-dependent methyltransferase
MTNRQPHDPARDGDLLSEVYDEWHAEHPDTEATVEFLARLAGNGPVLELGPGTGRLALPLAEGGLEVHGIEASERMVDRTRAKLGGDRVGITIGDFADVGVEGRFRLVFAAFNTFTNLFTQEDQVRCFANVARHLTTDGSFVIEALVPSPELVTAGHGVNVLQVEADNVVLGASSYDRVTQQLRMTYLVLEEGRVRLIPLHARFVWPAELDLMARLARLELKERWGGWRGEPFTANSTNQVSVYRAAEMRSGRQPGA